MDPVLFEELEAAGGSVGVATLNAEKSLNSLSLEMVELLLERLVQWRDDERISCVFLQGAGEKAFCAGGDIVKLYESMQEHGNTSRNTYAESFFGREYALDYLIHVYPKPIIVWGHGIVMGGGVGLMSGASHRVVTEKSRIAMPEISIGLFPDVGSTWFLNRTPGETGLFLGLTGANFNARDALYIGFADVYLESGKKQQLLDDLCQQEFSGQSDANYKIVSSVMTGLQEDCQDSLQALPAKVEENRGFIDEYCQGDTLAQAVEHLQAASAESPWVEKAVATLLKGCPVTAHLVWEQLHRGRNMSLEDVFSMEFCMAMQCAMQGDFREGVRALLIDKDNQPAWRHGSVAEVPAGLVESHFDYEFLPEFKLAV